MFSGIHRMLFVCCAKLFTDKFMKAVGDFHFNCHCSIIMASAAILLLSILIHLFSNTEQTGPQDDYYMAAVIEYSGDYDYTLPPLENALKNAKKHKDIIKKAITETKVDIVVFPELSLLSFDKSLFIPVPDPSSNIGCKNDSCHEILRMISEAAEENNVYVVINLHELYKNGSKEFKYNTNVVFDRKGAIIARYRKYNLFGETYLDRKDSPEYVTFSTDFGVTFGTFICFDIIFEEPAMGLINSYNITDIVYSSAWFSELPFHVGIQEQASWAYATDVNLLASGYNNMTSGNTGSGIYAGKNGPVVYMESETTGSKILIGKVPKISAKAKEETIEEGKIIPFEIPEKKAPPILKENLKPFVTKLIQPETLEPINEKQITINGTEEIKGLQKEFALYEKLCNAELCCNFNLSFNVEYYQSNYSFAGDSTFNKSDAFYHYKYRLIAFDGIRSYYVGNTSGEQICAIMPCLNESLESCAMSNYGAEPPLNITDKDLGQLILYSTNFNSISISGDFHNSRVLFLPSILISSHEDSKFGQLLDPKQIQFNITNNSETTSHVSLSFSPKKFASGGILVRLFERDNKEQNSNGQSNSTEQSNTSEANPHKQSNSANILTRNSFIWGLVPLVFYFIYAH